MNPRLLNLRLLVLCAWMMSACRLVAPYSSSHADALPADASLDDATEGDALRETSDRSDAHSPFLSLQLIDLYSGVDTVYPGQQSIRVYLTVHNALVSSVDLAPGVTVNLQSPSGQHVSEGVVRQCDEATALEQLPSGTTTEFCVLIHLDKERTPVGELELRAWVDGMATMDDGVVAVTSGRPSDKQWVWQVVEVQPILITTLHDELDLGTEPPFREEDAANGTGVSLREAIVLANTMASDSGAVPLIAPSPDLTCGQSCSIDVSQAYGALPPIERDGTQVDFTEKSLVISGENALRSAHVLVVTAADVTLRGIRVQDFNPGLNRTFCLFITGAMRTRLVDSHFARCGSDLDIGAQVTIDDGADHVVVGCSFVDGGRDGLRVSYADRVQIRHSLFQGNFDDGISLNWSKGHRVLANRIVGQGGSPLSENAGVELVDVTETIIGGKNQIIDNPIGVHLWRDSSTQVEIIGNELHNQGADVVVRACNRITVSRNALNGVLEDPIRLLDSANHDVSPPTVSEFDGTYVRGEVEADRSRVRAGRVEAYAREVQSNGTLVSYRFLAEAVVQDGTWELRLPRFTREIRLLYTNSLGSTSGLSELLAAP